MRIDSSNVTAAATETFGQAGRAGSTNKAGAQGSAAGQTVDTTSLHASTSDAAVQALTNQALQTFPTRAEKVSALQQAVASGQYQLDAERTALALTQADF